MKIRMTESHPRPLKIKKIKNKYSYSSLIMKLSFWKNKPVKVTKNGNLFKQILSNDELLVKINDEITNSKIQLDYSILNIDDLSDEQLNNMIEFINNNYIISDNDEFRLIYTLDLLKFYCRDTIILEFYPKDSDSKRVVGYIMGKRVNISLYNKDFKCLDVNFLCVIPTLRNLGLSSYMINSLTKESIDKYGIGSAHYTISSRINSPSFCKKQCYHRLINIEKLKDSNFFNSDININIYKKVYNTFSYHIDFNNKYRVNMIHNELDLELIEKLYNKYIDYAKKTYDIYDKITFDEFEDTFENDAFYHFIVYDAYDNIVSYVSLFRLDTLNYKKDIDYRSGYLYNMFFNKSIRKENVLESVHEYIYKNNVFDVTTFSDIFNINYNNIKCIQGSGVLRYYLFNITCNSIDSIKNGLITI